MISLGFSHSSIRHAIFISLYPMVFSIISLTSWLCSKFISSFVLSSWISIVPFWENYSFPLMTKQFGERGIFSTLLSGDAVLFRLSTFWSVYVWRKAGLLWPEKVAFCGSFRSFHMEKGSFVCGNGYWKGVTGWDGGGVLLFAP